MKAQFAGGLLLGFNFLWAVSALYGPHPVPIPRPPIGPIPGKGPMKFPGPGPAPIPFPGPPVPQVPIKRPALGPVPGPGPVIGPVDGPGFAVAGIFFYNWASTRENLFSGVCKQKRRRPACASAQSDQHLCYSLISKYHIQSCYQYSS